MAAELQTPELRVEEHSSDDYVKLVMEPLESGFGTTVGNALRRVLLASLPGAAITSVRIEGVDHEFSTVEHMQEDVTELLLNLKEVRLRAFADRPARLFLEASGETEVRAGDVRATADYEVVNPELHVATLVLEVVGACPDLEILAPDASWRIVALDKPDAGHRSRLQVGGALNWTAPWANVRIGDYSRNHLLHGPPDSLNSVGIRVR